MGKNKGFSSIKTYDELETSLRMVQRQLQMSRVTQKMQSMSHQVQSLKAGDRPKVNWRTVALLVLGRIKRRLS